MRTYRSVLLSTSVLMFMLGTLNFLLSVSSYWSQNSNENPTLRFERHGNSAVLKRRRFEFAKKYCNLTGIAYVDWWPSSSSWMSRAPYALIAGTKKAGTTSLFYLLDESPYVIQGRHKEMHLFGQRFHKYWGKYKTRIMDSQNKILVQQLRRDMYQNKYQTFRNSTAELNFPRSHLLELNASLISIDATPTSMTYPPSAIQRVLCSCPWVKIIMILREPVDRLWSHYNFLKMNKWEPDFMSSFEAFIDNDMQLMNESGLLNSTIDSKVQTEAWERYWYDDRVVEMQVARGLYVLQLQHWRDAMHSIGRNPDTEIDILRMENLERDPNATINHVLHWLGLPEMNLERADTVEMATEYKGRVMNPRTREKMDDFYKPYNERLYRMMERIGAKEA